MRLIADGLVDREGVGGLASRLSYSERQINRLLTAELGAGPLALARAQRAQTARTLIETTSMPITQIAFAAGFTSVRQFNDTIREVYASSPTELRGSRQPSVAGGTLTLRLPYRAPFHSESIFRFLGERAVPGVETWDGVTYRRSLRLNHGNAVVALSPGPLAPGPNAVGCTLHLDNVADVQAAVQRCRRLLDLDADPDTVEAHFADDRVLAPLVRKRPGLRSPGHPDGTELLTRAILGQQVSVKGARTLAARLVAAVGQPLVAPVDGVTHTFPSAESIAGCPTTALAMPGARARALLQACEQLACGGIVIDAGSDREEISRQLESLPGIGPWTASYVAMRALGDPDVFLPTDIGVRNALRSIGVESTPKAAAQLAESWRPWRSYALHHLWATL
jgi:AraC family transcriptional regulator of adaptative response / DNA-3-methyladenine glycosylase II